ncbi:MAG: DPP IV N-terminal domain-containing protein [Terracidiphilus sp.]
MIWGPSGMCRFTVLFCCLLASASGIAQQPAVIAADYARAEKFLPFNVDRLVYGIVRPNWIGYSDQFWYRKTMPGKSEFVLVDAATGVEQPAFDHAMLAATLSKAAGRAIDAEHLPFREIEFSPDWQSITFAIGERHFTCSRPGAACAEHGDDASKEALSPDGKRAAFIRDWNLWVRDVASGKETQLTHDGVKDYGYATDNAGWISSDQPIVLWSPDSRKIATFQQDQRKVGEMYLVETKVGHPVLQAWKYPLPGDEIVTMIERVIIDADTGATVRLKMPPDEHRSTLCDHIACGAGPNHAPLWADVEWSPDGATLAFVSTSRDHKDEKLRVADTATGEVREVYSEHVQTQFESGQGKVNWHYLPQSSEFLWYSEREGWGRLYLYDLKTGKLKNAVTAGDWSVAQVLRIDAESRQIWFTAVGREPGEDPYYTHLYKISFDGSRLTPLTPAPGNHQITASASGKYFVDACSTPETAPETLMRDESGKIVLSFGKADTSALVAMGWIPPVPVKVKARDGKTDLYGLMFVPTNLDKQKKYPIVDAVYPGPQVGSVGSRAFSAARRDSQSLAELGFIVVEIDGMGTAVRDKAFHDAFYGNMGDNTLPDQVAAIKELAAQYPYIDLDRVGIWGHSGGGFAAADAMFRYPEFFKVGISESGNHDQREYEDDWGERYQGLLTKDPNGKSNYDDQANENHAANLKGHLLLAHGTLDNNVPPYNTLLVVDALIRANKDFDLLLLPNQHHGYGPMSNYMMRRRWDYFVRWLEDTEPPKEFEITTPSAPPGQGGPDDGGDDE